MTMGSLARSGPAPSLWGSQAWIPPAMIVCCATQPCSISATLMSVLMRSEVTGRPSWTIRPSFTEADRSSSMARCTASSTARWVASMARTSSLVLTARSSKKGSRLVLNAYPRSCNCRACSNPKFSGTSRRATPRSFKNSSTTSTALGDVTPRRFSRSSYSEYDRTVSTVAVDTVLSYSEYEERLKRRGVTSPSAVDVVDEFLKDRGVARLLVPENFGFEHARQLQERGYALSTKREPFFEERAVKTKEEVRAIEATQRAVELAVQRAIELLRSASVKDGLIVHEGRPVTS